MYTNSIDRTVEFWTNCKGTGLKNGKFITYKEPDEIPIKMLQTQEQMIIRGIILTTKLNIRHKTGKIFAVNYLLKMLNEGKTSQDLEDFGSFHNMYVFRIKNKEMVKSGAENFDHIGVSTNILKLHMGYYYGYILKKENEIFIKNKAVFNSKTWKHAISNPKIGFDIGTYKKLRDLFPKNVKYNPKRDARHNGFMP